MGNDEVFVQSVYIHAEVSADGSFEPIHGMFTMVETEVCLSDGQRLVLDVPLHLAGFLATSVEDRTPWRMIDDVVHGYRSRTEQDGNVGTPPDPVGKSER